MHEHAASKAPLYLSCVPPLPNGIGIEKRAWAHLEALSAEEAPHVVLVLTEPQVAQLPPLDAARALCRSLHVLRLHPTKRALRHDNGLRLISNRLYHFGADALAFADADAQSLLKALGINCFTLVFCFRLRCFQVWRRLVQRQHTETNRLCVDFDDIESLAQRRELSISGEQLGHVGRICARIEAAEITRIENDALRKAEILVCSEEDRLRLRRRAPKARVHVVPNAFPMLDMLPSRQATPTLELLFIGALSYAPNIDAARFFCAEVLPLIEREWQQPVRLALVGRRPMPTIHALHAPPRIDVVGEVASVEPCYASCDIVVVPIRHGGGTRIKILEALSLGRPVVTTTMGCEGLGLRDGVDALIADSPEALALACLRLAHDTQLVAHLVEQGRITIDRHFRSERIQQRLREQLFPRQAT